MFYKSSIAGVWWAGSMAGWEMILNFLPKLRESYHRARQHTTQWIPGFKAGEDESEEGEEKREREEIN